MELDELVELVLVKLKEKEIVADELSDEEFEHYKKLTSLYQEQMSYAAQLPEVAGLFFDQEIEWSEGALKVLSGETVPAVLAALKVELAAIEDFEASEISSAIQAVSKETGVKGKNLFMPIRVATTGQQGGPQLGDAIELLGKEKVLDHIDEALTVIKA